MTVSAYADTHQVTRTSIAEQVTLGLLVHCSFVIGYSRQDISHDAARADSIHTHIVRRQCQRHAPAQQKANFDPHYRAAVSMLTLGRAP